MKSLRFFVVALVVALWLGGCLPNGTTPGNNPLTDLFLAPNRTPTPFQPVEWTPVPVVRPDFTPAPALPTGQPITIWLPDALTPYAVLPPNLSLAPTPDSAPLYLLPNRAQPMVWWTYALVAPFYELERGISFDEVRQRWNAGTLLMSPETRQMLAAYWGEPNSTDDNIRPAAELIDIAWDLGAWAIVPFDQLVPRWKVLTVDGISPLATDFTQETYPLSIPLTMQGEANLVRAIEAIYAPTAGNPILPASNRDPAKLTRVVMTGVTALVRATAWTMENQGILYPARDIGDWLRNADITHVSNEVPFAENCPFPNPVQAGVTFCSSPRYLDLLTDVSTDVVELTGDHFHDWGREAMLYTLDLYDEVGLPYYGGGATYDEGKQATLLEHNGNQIAFIGCNGKRGGFAQASATNPGSVACDIPWVTGEIARLTADGYLVIATFQHFEYYSYAFPNESKPDFQAVIDAGAAIASGSQAHHPHGFEFRGMGMIHYGLGNLFFDQYGLATGTELAFIDRHIIYDNQHISTELLGIRFEDFARSRPMTESEFRTLLQNTFAGSGW